MPADPSNEPLRTPEPPAQTPRRRVEDPSPWGGGVVDRRVMDKRQQKDAPSGMERRRGPGRRLSDSLRSAEEGEMTREQFLFLMAINEFKRANGVSFPNWSDVLEVVRLLGYRKTMKCEVRLTSAEDWTELPDAASNVRTDRQHQRHLAAERAAERAEADRSVRGDAA